MGYISCIDFRVFAVNGQVMIFSMTRLRESTLSSPKKKQASKQSDDHVDIFVNQ